MYTRKLLQPARAKFKKLFKQKRLPIYPIVQSKPIVIGDDTYTLVGQQTMKDSPILTNFNVYDETGTIAPHSIANRVYYDTMIAVCIDSFKDLKKTFKTQKKLSKKEAAIDDDGMGFVSKEMLATWQTLQDNAYKLNRMKEWDEQALASLHTYWNQFWDNYLERASLLFELGREGKLKKKHDKQLKTMNDCILHEAKVIEQLFYIEAFHLREDPLNLKEWLHFNAMKANANKREEKIHTRADTQSHLIMSVILYIFIYILTPYCFWLLYGKKFELIIVMSLVYIAFFALYYTNIYRLKKTFQQRMLPIWRKEETPIFRAAAISVNMPAAAFYVFIATVAMLAYYWYTQGWDQVANILLLVNIIVFGFTIWFAYSPFVEKILIFFPKKVLIGHREIFPDAIEHIEMDEDGVTYKFYLITMTESYEVRIENEEQARTKDFMIRWCEENELLLEVWK